MISLATASTAAADPADPAATAAPPATAAPTLPDSAPLPPDSAPTPPPGAGTRRHRRARLGRAVMRLALAVLAAAIVLAVLGFMRLADLLGSATLTSAYLAIVLYAAVEVLDGLIAWTLRLRPLSLLVMVRTHRARIKRRLQRGLRWLATGAWLVATLELYAVRQQVFEAVRTALDASVKLGSVEVTLGSVLLFAATLWATWLLTRLARFTLEEEVYPRTGLERGLAYAISKVVHYAVLVAGFVLALAALGLDMTRFTILAGAFGVGLGFGLQNIVNNFVSGLIVLFERPVEVGDLVQMDDSTGTVERIGIRASVIRTANGAAVIIPNGKLISDRVTNWTLTNRLRRVEIPVQIDPGPQPEQIIESLAALARANPRVMADPAPEVLFTKPGPGKLEFELRAWTRDVENAPLVRSELVVAINRWLNPADPPDPAAAATAA